MNSDFDAVALKLEHLNYMREAFVMRAALLPADLALLGLLDDTLDAASTVVQLCRDNRPITAFPLARRAFEATQRVIVLATEEDYVRVGTRAWLYCVRKDMRIVKFARGVDEAQEWYESALRQLQGIWSSHNSEAEMILREENRRLDAFQKNRRPDNFMGEELAEVVQTRYPKLVPASGKPVPEIQTLNRAIYAGLSGESHARLRLDPAGLQIFGDGTVRVMPRKVDLRAKQEIVLGFLDTSLAEATAALEYLLKERDQQQRDETQHEANRLAQEPLPPKFESDLGLHLMGSGGATTTFHFPSAPAQKLGILPEGTVTWSTGIKFGDKGFVVTFEVPPPLVAELAAALGIGPLELRPAAELRKHTLAEPTFIQLVCRLGQIQKNAVEAFVPLIATRVAQASPGAGA